LDARAAEIVIPPLWVPALKVWLLTETAIVALPPDGRDPEEGEAVSQGMFSPTVKFMVVPGAPPFVTVKAWAAGFGPPAVPEKLSDDEDMESAGTGTPPPPEVLPETGRPKGLIHRPESIPLMLREVTWA
jgi:hypothetical protein